MIRNGHRLSFLIVEEEAAQGLFTRRLLIESAKHNVITAHSAEEGSQMLRRFPNVDAIVMDENLNGNIRLAKEVKQHNPELRVVCLSPCIAPGFGPMKP